MMTTMAEKATKIYGTEIPLKHMGKRRQQLQQENAAAIAGAGAGPPSWEQKIIQKELQASSACTSKQQAAAVLTERETNATGARTGPTVAQPAAGPAPSANQKEPAKVVAPVSSEPHRQHRHVGSTRSRQLSGSQAPGTAPAEGQHKHHRGHYSQRSHHHHHHRHHHHHHHHDTASDGGKQQQVAAASHHQHHRNQHARSAGLSRAGPKSARSIELQKSLPLADEGQQQQRRAQEQDERTKPQDVTAAGGQQKMAPAEEGAKAPLDPVPVAASSSQQTADRPVASAEEPKSETADDDGKQPAGAKTGQRTESLVSTSSSASEGDPSASASSETRSSCSSLEAAQIVGQAAKLDQLQLADGGEDTADKQQALAGSVTGARELPRETLPEKADETAGLGSSEGRQGERIKLAVSLENVSDQQEVLRDPSKRITSDNKQRELDLVAQYEKLNFSARNSSLSQENDEKLVVKGAGANV